MPCDHDIDREHHRRAAASSNLADNPAEVEPARR